MTRNPLDWARSTIGWQPDGYVLWLPHSMKDRALLVFGRDLALLIEDRGWDFTVTDLTALVIDKNRGTTLGTIALRSEHLFSIPADDLRREFDAIAVRSTEHADEQAAWDQKRVAEYLEKLRTQPS